MSAAFLCRGALRRRGIPLALGLSSGALMVSRQKPFRLDAATATTTLGPPPTSRGPAVGPTVEEEGGWLSPEVIKQLSSGSLTGLLTGLLVSVFSKTLVLLIGVGMVVIQVASRYGIDLVDILKLRQRVQSSKILSALSRDTTFKLAFGVTFAMSAFMQF
ncbi:hypothetical protein NKR23_g10134 [Pleurostoma richardsiae]|uniref:Fun14 family protein n=1 Tax=Pleurostoma richardsiae TaxID=41990 RepID=A0AA38RFD8_9PEZI|nr:hypothetical protein NKR23_g10134 [Pleurostoma richardsiae]